MNKNENTGKNDNGKGNHSNNHNDKKKKFLFVSVEANIGDMAWQVEKEGNDVKYFIKNSEQRDVCDGFVDKTDDWESLVSWADVIIFDDVGFGSLA